MRFFKLFYLDFRRGIHSVWRLYMCEALLFILLCIDFWNRSRIFLEIYPGTNRSIGDTALFVFGGMRKFVSGIGTVFPFPTVWILVMSLACFSSLWYPLNDLYGFGKTILTTGQSRTRWYLAKAFWCGIAVTMYFLLGWIILCLSCLITGTQFTWTISPYMMELLELSEVSSPIEEWHIALQMTVLPWVIALALSQLQLCLSLWIQPALCWMISVVILLSSAYYANPVLPGNYAMALRDRQILSDGVNSSIGFQYAAGVILICLFVGVLSFKHADILGKEGKS